MLTRRPLGNNWWRPDSTAAGDAPKVAEIASVDVVESACEGNG